MSNSSSKDSAPHPNDRGATDARIAQAQSVNPFDVLRQGPLAPLYERQPSQPVSTPTFEQPGNPFHMRSGTNPLPINPNTPAWGPPNFVPVVHGGGLSDAQEAKASRLETENLTRMEKFVAPLGKGATAVLHSNYSAVMQAVGARTGSGGAGPGLRYGVSEVLVKDMNKMSPSQFLGYLGRMGKKPDSFTLQGLGETLSASRTNPIYYRAEEATAGFVKEVTGRDSNYRPFDAFKNHNGAGAYAAGFVDRVSQEVGDTGEMVVGTVYNPIQAARGMAELGRKLSDNSERTRLIKGGLKELEQAIEKTQHSDYHKGFFHASALIFVLDIKDAAESVGKLKNLTTEFKAGRIHNHKDVMSTLDGSPRSANVDAPAPGGKRPPSGDGQTINYRPDPRNPGSYVPDFPETPRTRLPAAEQAGLMTRALSVDGPLAGHLNREITQWSARTGGQIEKLYGSPGVLYGNTRESAGLLGEALMDAAKMPAGQRKAAHVVLANIRDNMQDKSGRALADMYETLLPGKSNHAEFRKQVATYDKALDAAAAAELRQTPKGRQTLPAQEQATLLLKEFQVEGKLAPYLKREIVDWAQGRPKNAIENLGNSGTELFGDGTVTAQRKRINGVAGEALADLVSKPANRKAVESVIGDIRGEAADAGMTGRALMATFEDIATPGTQNRKNFDKRVSDRQVELEQLRRETPDGRQTLPVKEQAALLMKGYGVEGKLAPYLEREIVDWAQGRKKNAIENLGTSLTELFGDGTVTAQRKRMNGVAGEALADAVSTPANRKAVDSVINEIRYESSKPGDKAIALMAKFEAIATPGTEARLAFDKRVAERQLELDAPRAQTPEMRQNLPLKQQAEQLLTDFGVKGRLAENLQVEIEIWAHGKPKGAIESLRSGSLEMFGTGNSKHPAGLMGQALIGAVAQEGNRDAVASVVRDLRLEAAQHNTSSSALAEQFGKIATQGTPERQTFDARVAVRQTELVAATQNNQKLLNPAPDNAPDVGVRIHNQKTGSVSISAPTDSSRRDIIFYGDGSGEGLTGESVAYTPRFHNQHGLSGEGAGKYTTISGHGVLESSSEIGSIGSAVQKATMVVPEGVNLYFMGLPGGTISDQLGQAADLGGDLRKYPLIKLGTGDTAPDLLITPGYGTINILGKPITVDNPQGVRLSQLIRDHDLSGNVVIAACLSQHIDKATSVKEKWQGVQFELPEMYRQHDKPDLSHLPPRLPIDPNFNNQHGLTNTGDGKYTAIGGNAILSGIHGGHHYVAEKTFSVPDGVTVYFPALPGGTVTNTLAEAIEKGQDLSRIPLLKAGPGVTAPDPVMLPGTYHVAGDFIRITEKTGQRLSEVIKEHGLTGNVVIAPGLAAPDKPYSDTTFQLPENYPSRGQTDGLRSFDATREQTTAPHQRTPVDNRQSSQGAPPQPGDPTLAASQQSTKPVEQTNASVNVTRNDAPNAGPAVNGLGNSVTESNGNGTRIGGERSNNGSRAIEDPDPDERNASRSKRMDGQSVAYTPRFSTQHGLTGESAGKYTTISGHGVIESDFVSHNIGNSVQRDTFVVPQGVNLHFLGLPGSVITDRLGQRADVGGDLTGVPLMKLGAGDTAPDILITPAFGTINIKGNPITVDNPQGVRLSQLIREHDLSGNIVVSSCLAQSVSHGGKDKWAGITFDLPDRYPKPEPPDLSNLPPRLPIDPNFHTQHGLNNTGDGKYTAIGGNASLSGTIGGKPFAEKTFAVPEGVTVYFPSLPGGSVHNRLGETIEKGEDLSRIPLLKAAAGSTAPDPLLFPGHYEVAGNFVRIANPEGQRLSEVIKEHGLTGNVVVAAGMAGPGKPHSNVLFDLPEQYQQRGVPGGTRSLDLNLEQVVAPRQQTPPQDNRQSSLPAPPQPGDATYTAYQQSTKAVEQLNASLNVPRNEATEKLVVAAATVAVQQNLRVDEVALSKPTATQPGGTTAFVIEKTGNPESERIGTVPMQQAMQKPLDEAYRLLAAAVQPQTPTQNPQQSQSQERQEQQQAAPRIV